MTNELFELKGFDYNLVRQSMPSIQGIFDFYLRDYAPFLYRLNEALAKHMKVLIAKARRMNWFPVSGKKKYVERGRNWKTLHK